MSPAILHPIERTNLMLSAGAVVASLALSSPLFALSLALGAAFEALNFRGLRLAAEALVSGQLSARRAGILGPRLVLLALAIGVALYAGAHPIGLVLGLSLILPAAVIEAWRARPPLDLSAPALPSDDEAWERWNPWLAREREAGEDDEEPGA
jgi:hypothetical protein